MKIPDCFYTGERSYSPCFVLALSIVAIVAVIAMVTL